MTPEELDKTDRELRDDNGLHVIVICMLHVLYGLHLPIPVLVLAISALSTGAIVLLYSFEQGKGWRFKYCYWYFLVSGLTTGLFLASMMYTLATAPSPGAPIGLIPKSSGTDGSGYRYKALAVIVTVGFFWYVLVDPVLRSRRAMNTIRLMMENEK